MTTWVIWRVLKHLSVAAYAAGLLGAAAARDDDDRQRAVYTLATFGLVGAWITGFGLLGGDAKAMGAPWISASLVLSLASLAAAAWSVERAGRRWAAWLAVVGAVGTVLLMTWRPGGGA